MKTLRLPGKPLVTIDGTSISLVLVTILALSLRLYRLDGQSLWYDEGTSVALAQHSIATIIHSAALDIHPPLYYIVLHYWVRLFGVSEFAVRLLSALAGVGVVWLVYLIGRRLQGSTIGLWAAFFAALSPFLVYYSQEARMYMLATLLGALSTWLVLYIPTPLSLAIPQASESRKRAAIWIAYVAATTAALYSHYFAATIILAQDMSVAAYLVVHLATRGRAESWRSMARRDLLPLLVAQAAVALFYAPWLPVMAEQFSQWPAISEFYNLVSLVAHLFPIFSLGLASDAARLMLPLLVFAAVLLAGVWPQPFTSTLTDERPTWRSRLYWLLHVENHLLPFFCLVVPVLAMFALSLRRPLYNPKFLLVAAPAFCFLLARGLSSVYAIASTLKKTSVRWQMVGPALALIAFLVIAGSSWQALRSYYLDARYARDDYRTVVQTIQAGERSGDAIILHAPGQTDIFGYYYKGVLPVYLLPRQRPLEEKATLAELADIAAKHSRLWVVYYGDQQADPTRVIASWLEKNTFKASDRWFGNVRLVLYAIPQASAGGMQPVNDNFGPAIRLLGYRLETAAATAGDIVPLTLFWQTSSALAERYTVFAHIIDTHNALWGQHDSEPGGGLQPTTTWRVGETVPDNYGIPVLPGTPPGSYQIEIGMYRPDSGQRLQITDSSGVALGDRVLVGPLVIARPATPPALATLGMQHTSTAMLGGLRLLGYNLGKLGQDAGATEFAGGDILHLTLFWQSPSQPTGDLIISVQALDGRGKIALQAGSRPADGDYPTNTWVAAEVVRDQHRIPLNGMPAGQYRIAIEVRDVSGRMVGQAQIGEIRMK